MSTLSSFSCAKGMSSRNFSSGSVPESPGLKRLREDPKLVALQAQLQSHPLYAMVNNKARLQIFMKSHAFAVLDFMWLLKSLQRGLTNVNKYWVPVKNTNSARFINSIVMGEETDEVRPGLIISHYEMYIKAMTNIGANTLPVETLAKGIAAGGSVKLMLDRSPIGNHTKLFVHSTIATLEKPLPYVAGSFFFGREDPIPQMFKQIVATLPPGTDYEYIKLYLERHIQVDEEDHGPLSAQLLMEISGGNDKVWDQILESGIHAIENRILLWDGIVKEIKASEA
jgi:hypothetical protein